MRTLLPHEQEAACGLVANLTYACTNDSEPFDEGFDGLTEADKAIAFERARLTLNMLTAGVVANCPVTVRPCPPRCAAGAASWQWSGTTWTPVLQANGVWLNLCGCSSACDCGPSGMIDLGGHVAEIVEVAIDGEALDESEYGLVDNRYLHRWEGTWPIEQDMDAPPGSVGTFEITYRPGGALGIVGEQAYGRLIVEYAKVQCGGDCALPKTVKRIQRQGASYEIDRTPFPNGLTQIREIDDYILSVNPHGLKTVTTVWTPKRPGYRVYR